MQLLPVHRAQIPPQAQQSRQRLPPRLASPSAKEDQKTQQTLRQTAHQGQACTSGQHPCQKERRPGAQSQKPRPPLPGQETAEPVLQEPGGHSPTQAPQDHPRHPPGHRRCTQVPRRHTGAQAHERSQEPDPEGPPAPVELPRNPGLGGGRPLHQGLKPAPPPSASCSRPKSA